MIIPLLRHMEANYNKWGRSFEVLDFMKKKFSYKKLSSAVKIIVNMNLVFAILTLAYFYLAEKVNIYVLLTMTIFEILYLIISFSFIIFGNYDKENEQRWGE
ncbi:MAG: hypothetical protein HFH62_13160 [Lachnospiraceae bacterium]|nr:hypothetical protein [Lachnospiraceae bacterium]